MRFIAYCALALALGLSSCKRGPDIKADPTAVGQTVSLTGTIKQVYEPSIVELHTNRGNVLVVTPQPAPALKRGDRVAVTGDVRHLTAVEFERNFAVDADAQVEARVQAENFVAAHEIKPA